MTSPKIPSPTLQQRSHQYNPNHTNGEHEAVYETYATEWRGIPVTVHLHMERTNWRGEGWPSWGLRYDHIRAENGDTLTDTARTRLYEACAPLIALYPGSDEYADGRRHAVARALVHEAQDMHSRHDLDRVRRMVERHQAEAGTDTMAKLALALDAYEVFLAAIGYARDPQPSPAEIAEAVPETEEPALCECGNHYVGAPCPEVAQ